MRDNILVDEHFVRKAILSEATRGLISPNFRLIYFLDSQNKRSINFILEKDDSEDRENIEIIAEDYFCDLSIFLEDRKLSYAHLFPCETNIIINNSDITYGMEISFNFVYCRSENNIRFNPDLD